MPQPKTYQDLRTHLLTPPAPLTPPKNPTTPTLSEPITSLRLHPTLEALLHLLNHDLPSAHFLARHMQSAPAHEGMYIHGLLHRIEGDYVNARAWYNNVCESEVFVAVWGQASEEEKKEIEGEGMKKMPAQRKAREWIDDVEGFVRRKKGDRRELEERSRREMEVVLKWCEDKFGTDAWEDVSGEGVRPSQEIRDIGNKMTTGGEGYRKF